MAKPIEDKVDTTPGAPAEKPDLAPDKIPELMRDWHQTKGKTELTTGEEVEEEDTEVVERAIDANRDLSQRKEAVERAKHPESNRDGN